MTAREIADRFVGNDLEHFGGPITPARIRKLIKLCERSKVPLADVIALLPADVTAKMNG